MDVVKGRSTTTGYFENEQANIRLSDADSSAYLVILSDTKDGIGIYTVSRYVGHTYVISPVVPNARYTVSMSGNILRIVSTYAAGVSVFNIAR